MIIVVKLYCNRMIHVIIKLFDRFKDALNYPYSKNDINKGVMIISLMNLKKCLNSIFSPKTYIDELSLLK